MKIIKDKITWLGLLGAGIILIGGFLPYQQTVSSTWTTTLNETKTVSLFTQAGTFGLFFLIVALLLLVTIFFKKTLIAVALMLIVTFELALTYYSINYLGCIGCGVSTILYGFYVIIIGGILCYLYIFLQEYISKKIYF